MRVRSSGSSSSAASQGIDGLGGIAGQAPVARQVVVQQGFVGMGSKARWSASMAWASRLVRL